MFVILTLLCFNFEVFSQRSLTQQLIIQPPNQSQTKINVVVNDINFFSNFDNGNLAEVKPHYYKFNFFKLWLGADCSDLQPSTTHDYRLWFYFGVINRRDKPRLLTLNIENLKPKLFEKLTDEQKYIFVQRNGKWSKLSITSLTKLSTEMTRITFKLKAKPNIPIRVALQVPWTYNDNKLYLSELQLKFQKTNAYFIKQVLIKSLDGLSIHLLTITNGESKIQEKKYGKQMFPESVEMPKKFNKPYILISCRVHPGEAPSSYVLKGLLDMLSQNKGQAKKFLDKYVLLVIPILNPDGVYRGYYRLNSIGYDENRIYNRMFKQNKFKGPYALLEVVKYFGNRLKAFIDLHSHTQVLNSFLYMNYHPDPKVQEKILRFPALMNNHLKHFKRPDNLYINKFIGDHQEQFEGQFTETKKDNDGLQWHPSKLSIKENLKEFMRNQKNITNETTINKQYKYLDTLDGTAKQVVFAISNMDMCFSIETHYRLYQTSWGVRNFRLKHFLETGRAIIKSLLEVNLLNEKQKIKRTVKYKVIRRTKRYKIIKKIVIVTKPKKIRRRKSDL